MRTSSKVYLLILIAALSGCEGLGYLRQALGERQKPVFTPQDKPTLVLVDDPNLLLGEPGLSVALANQVGFELTHAQVLGPGHAVPLKNLLDLQSSQGPAFAKMPVDRVGQATGAQQVIYIFVQDVTLSGEPGILKPQATVQVKVIDAATGTRLFPAVDNKTGASVGPSTYTLATTMNYRYAEQDSPTAMHEVAGLLANKIGRDVANLFHEHLINEPGEKFKD